MNEIRTPASKPPLEQQDEPGSIAAHAGLQQIELDAIAGHELAGLRADAAAARLFAEHSRARLSGWIKSGELRVDGRQVRPRDLLSGGERLTLSAQQTQAEHALPEAIPLGVLYSDADLMIIDKPAGLVVHPGAGNPTGTLVNALLHLDPELNALPRAGIVHRLDKDTTGCLLIARTLRAHAALVALLAERLIHRQYEAVVQGEPVAGGTVDAPIGRHPVDRLRMAVNDDGRPAVTHYRVRERFRGFTSLQVNLETGRTHQIRVHMANMRLPLLGDPLYSTGLRLPKAADPDLVECLRGFRRQALHAETLRFRHPFAEQDVNVSAPRPADLERLLGSLRTHAPRDEH